MLCLGNIVFILTWLFYYVERMDNRCHQISTNTSANAKPGPRRPMSHLMGANNNNNNTIPDIAASTLWYHNYDRSCICGGMWLEL